LQLYNDLENEEEGQGLRDKEEEGLELSRWTAIPIPSPDRHHAPVCLLLVLELEGR
jgi:hypothetical protein